MQTDPILLIGGSGVIGRWTARFLRAAHPNALILIGGRDRAKSDEAAAEVGNAEGMALDLNAENLGLGDRAVSAVAVLLKDDAIAALRFAQSRGVPHISVSSGIHEIGPEVASYMHKPDAGPVVLGAEWLVGATTVPALEFAKAYGRVDDIVIGALVDEHDVGGPASEVDVERLTRAMPAALTRRDGRYVWRVGDDAKASFRAIDGRRMQASALAPYDVVALATATGAPNVQFNLATGMSSTRRRGEPMSTEIIIELAGEDMEGRPLRTRHAVVHPQGQMPLTGLGVAMVLERLIGLDGNPATPAGLFFPYQLLESATYLARLKKSGGTVLQLEVL
ncbi:NAD(P)-dependent dehydrogenase (short-subunit alcohol dehydrogenase family) [Devosia sp. UYZn731]|uniref:NAD(P)-dependent oxidoreductase n=1 Tax=Devosia sp. UYZn731 TaxID=3156345 RepID=UPI00339AA344